MTYLVGIGLVLIVAQDAPAWPRLRHCRSTCAPGIETKEKHGDRVEGVVTQARRPLYEISLGTNQGVKTGDRVTVWRNRYLGELIVVYVTSDTSVGEIAYKADWIQKGDRTVLIDAGVKKLQQALPNCKITK